MSPSFGLPASRFRPSPQPTYLFLEPWGRSPGLTEESRAGGILQSGAESQRIAVWWLLYRVQHPGRYLSRLQTDRRSLKPCAALCSVLGRAVGLRRGSRSRDEGPALDRLRVWTAERPGTRAAGHIPPQRRGDDTGLNPGRRGGDARRPTRIPALFGTRSGAWSPRVRWPAEILP